MTANAAELTLRTARLEDLDAIWAIETAVFASDAWSRSALQDELTGDHRRYLVAEDAAGEVRAYAGVQVVGSEADVQTIAVAPEHRGRGHGRRLMLALMAEARARGARELFLEVRADNPVAHGLYLALGFTDLGVRPQYYQPDGVDAIVMRHNLKET